jgi:hypothetical protein
MPRRQSNQAIEATNRAEAIRLLKADGFVVWYPPKPRFAYQDCDIFGVYDLLAVKGPVEWHIQITTVSNLSARKKKIQRFLHDHDVEVLSQVWAWNADKREFKIVEVT